MQGKKGIVVGAALAFAIFALVFDPVLSLVQTSTTVSNNGSITPGTVTADYTITGTGSTASAVENLPSGSGRTTSGATVTVINTVIGWMSSGQTVEFIGSFAINTMVSVSKSSVTLDFGTATIVIASSVVAGFAAASGTSNIAFLNGDISGGQFGIAAGSGSSSVIIQGCHIHGQVASGTDGPLLINNNGYNQIINCKLYDGNQLIYVAGTASHNTISGSEFYNFGGGGSAHAIYLDGGGASSGTNEISGNNFHNARGGSAGVLVKCAFNKIHGNQFTDFATGGVPLSIFSQYSGAHADDNEIYNNTFTNCGLGAIWFGNTASVNPEYRNKIHDNTFTSCTDVILLNHESTTALYDTWIYYNKFISCTNFCRVTGSTNVINTVIAYNDFSQSPVSNKSFETSYTNTMVYSNTGLADFNVPSPLPIPPR